MESRGKVLVKLATKASLKVGQCISRKEIYKETLSNEEENEITNLDIDAVQLRNIKDISSVTSHASSKDIFTNNFDIYVNEVNEQNSDKSSDTEYIPNTEDEMDNSHQQKIVPSIEVQNATKGTILSSDQGLNITNGSINKNSLRNKRKSVVYKYYDIENSELTNSDTDRSDANSEYIPDKQTDSSTTETEEDRVRVDSPVIPFTLPNWKTSMLEAATKKKRNRRIWNKRDYCYFCETDVLKFSRHVLRHHSCEFEVQEIMALAKGSHRRKVLFNKLRNQGNFLKSSTEEKLIPVRKPQCGDPTLLTVSTYLPCKFCKGFYKKRSLFRHIKICPLNVENKALKTNAQSDGQSLLSAYRHNDILRKEIFPTLRADSISLAAKSDTLICAVASRYLKSHRDVQYRIVASRKMRQLGSLLIEIRKHIKTKNFIDALEPSNFDIFVRCTKIISKYNPDTESYGAPSLAANMGTMLKECIDVAYSILLKHPDNSQDNLNKLKTLKELITNEWRYEISTLANSDLQRKRWNKPSLIPLADDLSLLRSYLLSESKKYAEKLMGNQLDQKAFKILQEIIYVQLILLNRRRVGELQRMTITSYNSHINNQTSSEFDNCISEAEKLLMKSFKRIVIRGKRGRGVPVLFTDQMVKHIDVLLSCRDNFISKSNMYLFANMKTNNNITGTQAVYKHVRLAGVKNATAITSTKLRKHLATMSQVIDLSKNDLEQLASFMGHTSNIHKNYYRLPNDIYQTAKISKLLLLSEKGQTSKYKGKRLEDIDLNLDTEDENSDDEIGDTIITTVATNHQEAMNTNPEKTTTKSIAKEPIAKAKRTLEPWNAKQKNVTLTYFRNHLKTKTPPKKHECLELKQKHNALLENKSWEKIKIYVVNTYNKQK